MRIMYFGFEENGEGLRSYCTETGCEFIPFYCPEFSFVSDMNSIISEHPDAAAIDISAEIDSRDDISDGVFQLQQSGISVLLIAINPDAENAWRVNAFRNAESAVIDTAAGTAYENVLHATGKGEKVLSGDSVSDMLPETKDTEKEESVEERSNPNQENEEPGAALQDENTEKPLSRKELKRRKKEQKKKDREEQKRQLALQKQAKKKPKTITAPPSPASTTSVVCCLPRRIAVVGCCPRIGTTTAALQTAMFLKKADPKQNILYQQRNGSGFVDCIKNYVSGYKEKKNGMISYQGIDMIDDPSQVSRRTKKQYSYIITDYGNAQEADFLSVMDQDMVLNICGIFPTELSSFEEIFRNTNEHASSFYLFNLVPEDNRKWVMESQQDNRVRTFFLDYAPDPFTLSGKNAAMLTDLSKRYEQIGREGGFVL